MSRAGRPARALLLAAGLAVVVTPLSTVLTASTAAAHNALVSTTPASGATVATMPTEVVLHFDQPSGALGTRVVVLGPAGDVAAGGPRLLDDDVRQPTGPGSPAGTYTVNWRVVSADGHPVQGTFRFTTTRRSPGTPPAAAAVAPTAATAATNSPPGRWVITALALTVAAAAAVTVAAVRRRTPSP